MSYSWFLPWGCRQAGGHWSHGAGWKKNSSGRLRFIVYGREEGQGEFTFCCMGGSWVELFARVTCTLGNLK